MRRRMAILCAPFRDRTEAEAGELRIAKAKLVVNGWVPIFLPDTLAEVLSDRDATERKVAIGCSTAFVEQLARVTGSQMVIVGERMTEGMKSDAMAWLDAGGPAPVTANLLGHAFAGQED